MLFASNVCMFLFVSLAAATQPFAFASTWLVVHNAWMTNSLHPVENPMNHPMYGPPCTPCTPWTTMHSMDHHALHALHGPPCTPCTPWTTMHTMHSMDHHAHHALHGPPCTPCTPWTTMHTMHSMDHTCVLTVSWLPHRCMQVQCEAPIQQLFAVALDTASRMLAAEAATYGTPALLLKHVARSAGGAQLAAYLLVCSVSKLQTR